MIHLVYAVVPSGDKGTSVRGLRGERLRFIDAGTVGALVGDISSPPRPTGAALRAYHDTIIRLAAQHAALIPVRFGTVADDQELTFILRARAASFRRLLTRVRGRAQMTVRFVTRARMTGEGGHLATSGSSGLAYLQQRAASHRRLRELPAVRQVRDVVAQWIRDERIERHRQVVTIYHLVPRVAASRYLRAMAHMNEPAGLQVSGPFPPFAFADPFDLEAAHRPGPRGPGAHG